jgi:hypothetical protein
MLESVRQLRADRATAKLEHGLVGERG